MEDEIFRFLKPNEKKLKEFGFTQSGEALEFKTQILDGQFDMLVSVDVSSGKVLSRLIDRESHEEYVMHLVGGAGSFVGKVREEYLNVLNHIAGSCFEREVHKSKQAREVIEFVHENFGDSLEYLWKKFPTDAIWRRADNKKWYGLIMTIPKSKIVGSENVEVEILDVRFDPEKIDIAVDDTKIFRGYHMNKKHWITVVLDGTLATYEIFELLKNSYALAK